MDDLPVCPRFLAVWFDWTVTGRQLKASTWERPLVSPRHIIRDRAWAGHERDVEVWLEANVCPHARYIELTFRCPGEDVSDAGVVAAVKGDAAMAAQLETADINLLIGLTHFLYVPGLSKMHDEAEITWKAEAEIEIRPFAALGRLHTAGDYPKGKEDFTVYSNGVAMPCHRAALAKASPVFDGLLDIDHKGAEVKLIGDAPAIVKRMLTYIHYGVYNEKYARELYVIANKYNVKTLKLEAMASVVRQLNAATVIPILWLLERHLCEEAGVHQYIIGYASSCLDVIKGKWPAEWEAFAASCPRTAGKIEYQATMHSATPEQAYGDY